MKLLGAWPKLATIGLASSGTDRLHQEPPWLDSHFPKREVGRRRCLALDSGVSDKPSYSTKSTQRGESLFVQILSPGSGGLTELDSVTQRLPPRPDLISPASPTDHRCHHLVLMPLNADDR